MAEMLVAVTSGYVEDAGELVEITAGQTRIAPDVLERAGYGEYFERGVSARGTDSDRAEIRVTGLPLQLR